MLNEADLKKLNIAVAGIGVSGKAVVEYLLDKEVKQLYLIDSNIDKIKDLYGQRQNINCLQQNLAHLPDILSELDLIILSPGIERGHPMFEKFLAKGGSLIGEIEFAYQVYFSHRGFEKTKVVAVTGTNGKTTTVTMLSKIFEAEGLNFFVGGNIGTPFIQALKNHEYYDVILLELSSFQLESIIHFHANIGLILNIFPNHGERYEGVQDYFLAKWELSKNMTTGDWCFFPDKVSLIQDKLNSLRCDYRLIEVDDKREIVAKLEKDFSLEKYQLLGTHNLINLSFCLEVSKHLNISKESIQQVIDTFQGVEHRVELCPSHFPFQCINDAKSTNIDATITALNSLDEDKETYLIMGGKLRGHGESLLPYADTFKKKVRRIYLIGESTEQLSIELQQMRVDFIKCMTLEKAVAQAKEISDSGRLLFSPGFPSFDQFNDYAHRGRAFKELVR